MWDLRLALLEGRFDKTINSWRKPVVDYLSDVLVRTPHGYCHEMLPDVTALPALITRLGRRRDMRWLYVASHGSQGGIYASDGKVTPTAAIAAALDVQGFEGAFFSSCRFASHANARRLLLQPNTSLKWLAGYTEMFDWVHGTAIELYFWYWFLYPGGTADTLERLREVAAEVDRFMPGAHSREGLQIYVRAGRDVERLLGVSAPEPQSSQPLAERTIQQHQPSAEIAGAASAGMAISRDLTIPETGGDRTAVTG